MSDLEIGRRVRTFGATVGTSVASSSAVDMSDAAGASVLVDQPSSNATTLQIFCSDHTAGTFRRLDGDGIKLVRLTDQLCTSVTTSDGTTTSTVQICTAYFSSVSGWYAMPDGVFPVGAVKLVSDATLGDSVVVRLATKS